MEKSKHSQEILALGKQLVAEFSNNGRSPLTTSWMAHYLSEIMDAAEEEVDITKKRKLQKECTEIILELWKRRSVYPGRTKPAYELRAAVTVLSTLLKEEEPDPYSLYRFRGFEEIATWGGFMKHSREILEETFAIAICLSVSIDILDREKRWLKHENLLTEEEREIISKLDQLITDIRVRYNIQIIFKEDEIEKQNEESENISRLERALNKLESLALEQVQNVQDLRNRMISGKNILEIDIEKFNSDD